MTEQRPNYIDYAKVITMFLVIYGHYIPYMGLDMGDNAMWGSVHIINLFHMPLFFFVSGMLFKRLPFKETIKKAWSTLGIPYLLLGLITITIGLSLSGIKGTLSIGQIASNLAALLSGGDFISELTFSGPLWFCYALIIIKMIQSINLKIVAWGGVIFGVIILYKGNVLPCRIDSALVGNLFFMMGYYSKSICSKVFSNRNLYLIPVGLAGILLLIAVLYMSDDIHAKQVLSINACYFGKYPLFYLAGGIGGIMLIFAISSLLSAYKYKVVLDLSVGMIITLGFQKILFTLLKNVIEPTYSLWMAIGLSLLVYVICYLLIKLSAKHLPILMGNRKLN